MNADQHGWNNPKAKLRSETHALLKSMSPTKRAKDSAEACALLRQQNFWKSAGSVLFFAPLPREIDVWPLLEESLATGKIIMLPRFDPLNQSYLACRVQHLESEIVAGQFGIREPSPSCVEIPLTKLDLLLVPGVAFAFNGRRLGRGQGFYDRLLAEARGVKCGIAFDEQITEAIPDEAHDIKMNYILTPVRLVKCAE